MSVSSHLTARRLDARSTLKPLAFAKNPLVERQSIMARRGRLKQDVTPRVAKPVAGLRAIGSCAKQRKTETAPTRVEYSSCQDEQSARYKRCV